MWYCRAFLSAFKFAHFRQFMRKVHLHETLNPFQQRQHHEFILKWINVELHVLLAVCTVCRVQHTASVHNFRTDQMNWCCVLRKVAWRDFINHIQNAKFNLDNHNFCYSTVWWNCTAVLSLKNRVYIGTDGLFVERKGYRLCFTFMCFHWTNCEALQRLIKLSFFTRCFRSIAWHFATHICFTNAYVPKASRTITTTIRK